MSVVNQTVVLLFVVCVLTVSVRQITPQRGSGGATKTGALEIVAAILAGEFLLAMNVLILMGS